MHYKEAKTILSSQNGMNIYRGCTHGCIYCDSRSKCYNMQHRFEDIEVKINAPILLEQALMKKKNKCMVGTGAMSDPYLPEEKQLGLTRKCLEIIYKYNCGLAIQTKSDLILRDLDLLKKINNQSKVVVEMTLTTFDEELCKKLEPNVCTTKRRFEVLKIMHENNIKTIVWLCPFLPFINDNEENMRGLIKYCVDAHVYGIIFFGCGLTLREGNRDYFYEKLDKYFPSLKEKYIKKYGNSYGVGSDKGEYLYNILKEECQKNNIILDNDILFEYMHTYPKKIEQLSLF